MGQFLAGVDVGTTGTRCVIFDLTGAMIGGAYREYGATYPQPGWVEQDGEQVIAQTIEACQAAVAQAGVSAQEIASVGFSTQGSVTGPVDRQGQLLRPLFSWQDTRTGQEIGDLGRLIAPDAYYAMTGVPLAPNLVMPKLLWMRRHEPALYARTYKFTQMQDVILKAFGAEDYYTDLPDMSFYGVWDVREARWQAHLLELFQVTPDVFGTPTPAGTQVGTVSHAVAAKTGLAVGTPLCVGGWDQHCALVGMGGIEPGMATVTLGTAGVAMLVVATPVPGFGGMLMIHHAVQGLWTVAGASLAAAGAYRWFRDTIGTLERERASQGGGDAYDALNALAAQAPPGSRGLLFLPYLATAGTPYWNVKARAAFIGLSLTHGRAELTRAVMEGVALEMRDIMTRWWQQGMAVKALRLGGGATRSRPWTQIQADVYRCPVQTLQVEESTVLGAALLGGVGAGVFRSIQEGVECMVHVTGEITPQPEHRTIYDDMYTAYVSAYEGLSQHVFDKLAAIQTAT